MIYLGSIVDFSQFWEVSKEVQDGLAVLPCSKKKRLCAFLPLNTVPECSVLPASQQELAQGKGVFCSSSPSGVFLHLDED